MDDELMSNVLIKLLCDVIVNYSFIHVDSLIVLNIFPRVMSNAVCVVNQYNAVELFYANLLC